jgi:hypothetical protein
LEVGAGIGLISTILKPHLDANAIGFEASDPVNPWINPGNIIYPNLQIKKFGDYTEPVDPNSLVMISWLHSKYENEFLDMIKRCGYRNIIMIGEGVGKSCFSNEFHQMMISEDLSYKLSRIPALSICSSDYFAKDNIRTLQGTRNICRSEIILFSKDILLTSDQVRQICGSANLGMLPIELSGPECMQDMGRRSIGDIGDKCVCF